MGVMVSIVPLDVPRGTKGDPMTFRWGYQTLGSGSTGTFVPWTQRSGCVQMSVRFTPEIF